MLGNTTVRSKLVNEKGLIPPKKKIQDKGLVSLKNNINTSNKFIICFITLYACLT